MGAVPNAVFERLLEAVAAGQSAELMEQLNLLVNAGHSPSSLARQMVRYLRNALMAKLGGEQTELLQISGDERARAARTALLFTEEELTRNLQIVLRTFDDLNYRQEQRFHLELGLLKLIHAQRLLPIEELLSGVGMGTRPAARRPAHRHCFPFHHAPAPPRAQRVRPRRRFRLWVRRRVGARFQGAAAGCGFQHQAGFAASPVVTMERPSSSEAVSPTANRQAYREVLRPSLPRTGGHQRLAATLTEGALAKAPQTEAAPSIESIRHAVGCALVEGGHVSAAQLLGAGAWTLDGASLRIEVPAWARRCWP
jgi:DNA polymerase III subunit gamma/tau